MADSQTGLSASVSTAKTDIQSENVTETREDQKTQTQSVETKEQGSESTYHENPKQESQNASMLEKKETGQEEKLTSKDGKETPMQIDVESKSLSEVPDTKANTDQGSDDSKGVGDDKSKTKSDGLCGNIKQAESPETKTSLSSDATKDNNQEASLSASNMESKTTKHAEANKKKIPDDNHSGKGLGKEPEDKQTEILKSETQKEEKVSTEESSELAGDKGEKTAPKDDGKKSDAKNVSPDDNTDSKGSKEVGKDTGETAGTVGETMETAENKDAGNVTDVADDKDNADVKEDTDKAAAHNTEGTDDKKEGKTEAGKEPDAEPEEPPVPKIPNGVSVKGKGSRRKGNPKRAIPDDTPEPSTSTAETKATRGQATKRGTTQPPSKKRKTSEEPRSQPTRRSKRRKFHGWGAKRKTRPARNP